MGQRATWRWLEEGWLYWTKWHWKACSWQHLSKKRASLLPPGWQCLKAQSSSTAQHSLCSSSEYCVQMYIKRRNKWGTKVSSSLTGMSFPSESKKIKKTKTVRTMSKASSLSSLLLFSFSHSQDFSYPPLRSEAKQKYNRTTKNKVFLFS